MTVFRKSTELALEEASIVGLAMDEGLDYDASDGGGIFISDDGPLQFSTSLYLIALMQKEKGLSPVPCL